MKKTTALLASALGTFLGPLHAQTVPPFISYQGKVTDSAGAGLGSGSPVNRKAIFRIYDAPSGGNRLWSEQHTVTISNGEFSVLLGNGIDAVYNAITETPSKTTTPLDSVFTSGGILRYVEIVVDNGDNTLNTSDAAIAPRQQITSTAYSFRARSADVIASGTDLQLNASANYGLGYYGPTRLFNGTAVDGPVLYGQAGGALGSVNGGTKNIALRWNSTGAVGIGSADLSGAGATTKLVLQGDDANSAPLQLNIRGNTDSNKRLLVGYNTTSNYGSLQAYSTSTGTANLLLNPAGGNVGIGTATPGFPLNFGSTLGDKVSLWGASGNTFGFGVQGSLLQIHSDVAGSDIAFGYGASATMTEVMRIKGSGNVGIGTSNPGAKLDVSGTGLFSGNVGVGVANPGAKLDVNGTGLFSGNVGIGVAAPAYRLDVAGTARISGDFTGTGTARITGDVFSGASGNFKPSGSNSNGIQWVDAGGGIQAHIFRYGSVDNRLYFTNNFGSNLTGVYLASGGTSLTSTSDERLKSEIEPVTGILGKIENIRIVGYNMATMSVDTATGKTKIDRTPHRRNTRGGKAIKQEIGSIAQDWIANFPELVVEPQSDDQFYGLNYDRIGVVALGAVKELHQVVNRKDAEISALKERLKTLEDREKVRDAKLSEIEARLTGSKGAK